MKKIFLLILIGFALMPNFAYAQTNSKVDKTIDQLKDKVASKVAQLNLVQKRGMIGTVSDVSKTQITLNDLNGNKKLVDTDELTNYSSDDDNSFGFSDIKKGMQLSILGLYNKDSDRLLARFVDVATLPEIHQGVISNKDDKNLVLTFSTQDGALLIDVEDVTKEYEYYNGKLTTLGFSKVPTSVNAIIVGFPDKKEKNRLTASRIIVFPGIPKNPKIPIVDTVAPSSPAPTK